jgi:hypothetical protein
LTSDRGARKSFAFLILHHLFFVVLLLLFITAQLIGEFWKNRLSGTGEVASIVLAHQQPSCTFRRTHSAFKQSAGAFAVPINKNVRIFVNHRASPVGGVKMAAPIVLA